MFSLHKSPSFLTKVDSRVVVNTMIWWKFILTNSTWKTDSVLKKSKAYTLKFCFNKDKKSIISYYKKGMKKH